MKRTTPLIAPLLAAALMALPLLAHAFEVSEETVNRYVAQKLAERPPRHVQVSDPRVTLLDGHANLCANLRHKAVPSPVAFCADMTPVWHRDTGSLHATRLALRSLNAPGLPIEETALLKLLLNQSVLPRLEGFEIYKTDEPAARLISEVHVLPGKLDLVM